MNKAYLLIVLFLCGLSVRNLFAAASASAAASAAAAVDKILEQALEAAAGEGHEPMVKELIARGTDVNAAHRDGWTALIMAALRGHENIVERLLQANGINVNAANRDGYTALIWAAEEGHEHIVERLLQVEGINVNATTDIESTTLMLAARGGHENIVKKLLDAGADTTIKTNWGQTAYDVAKTQEIKNMLERARLWQVQEVLLEVVRLKLQPAGDMFPPDMIGEIMGHVEDAEFPKK